MIRPDPVDLEYALLLRWSAGLDRCLEGVSGAPTAH